MEYFYTTYSKVRILERWQLAILKLFRISSSVSSRIYPILFWKKAAGFGSAWGGGVGGISCSGFSSQGLSLRWTGEQSTLFWFVPDGVRCRTGGSRFFSQTPVFSVFGCMFAEMLNVSNVMLFKRELITSTPFTNIWLW